MVIFSASLSNDPVNALGSNLLKVTIGLSALVFIIMLQAHHNHDPDSPHSGYISGVCHNTAVEVFDSVKSLLQCPLSSLFDIYKALIGKLHIVHNYEMICLCCCQAGQPADYAIMHSVYIHVYSFSSFQVTLLSLLVVHDKGSHFSKIWNFDQVIAIDFICVINFVMVLFGFR